MINPANILITGPAQRVCLIDFALAAPLAPGAADETAALVGALAYLAPEQCALTGHHPDGRVDLYALGATPCTKRPAVIHHLARPMR